MLDISLLIHSLFYHVIDMIIIVSNLLLFNCSILLIIPSILILYSKIKNIFSLESKITSNTSITSSILILGRKFKLPDPLKFLLGILLITAIILKLLGVNSIFELITNIKNLCYFVYVVSSIVIIYILLNICLLNYFMRLRENKKNIDSFIENYKFLPQFIIS